MEEFSTVLLALAMLGAAIALIWRVMRGREAGNPIPSHADMSPTYAFRVRIDRAVTDTIESGDNEITLDAPTLPAQLVLRNKTSGQAIKDGTHFCLVAGGFASEQEALEAGKLHETVLAVALARARVGADFGDRAAKGMFTTEGLKLLEQQHGHRVLNDVHGLMTYVEHPPPKFVLSKANMLRGANLQVFKDAFHSAAATMPVFSQQERLAFTLFNASFFQPTADSRFLLLVMSIEALIEPEARSGEAQAHVQSLIAATAAAAIPDAEKASMLGSLRWLAKESINQAGKRLVTSRLGTRQYEKNSAAAFFTHVYQMRSNLVHGNLPYPSFEVVGAIAAPLEVFVSDLLTQPFIGLPPEPQQVAA